MAITRLEARRIKNKHEDYLDDLNKAIKYQGKAKKKIIAALDNMKKDSLEVMLKGIPVEELNRDKQGIRVKTLKDAGYENVFSIYDANLLKLGNIEGISSEMARLVKDKSQEIASRANREVKVSLSYDNQDEKSSELVKCIADYRLVVSKCEDCWNLLSQYEDDIQDRIKEARPITSLILGLFANDEAKKKAIEALEWLDKLLKSDYPEKVKKVVKEFEDCPKEDKNPWESFKNNTIEFNNILALVSPDALDSGNAKYGLPEELAASIAKEEYDLTGLKATLRNYQDWGVKYILHQGKVLLGDEMGLGKTVQAIASLVALHNAGATHFMVVCPASVLANWAREIAKFSELNVIKIHGADRMMSLLAWQKNGGVAVTTFETTDFIKLNPNYRYSMLVVDEAHYIKNPGANRSNNVKRLCNNADRILFMTGTALENNVNEMLNLINILDPTIATSASSIAFMASAKEFRDKIAAVYYRRRRLDVLTELPEKTENLEWCTLSAYERDLYNKSLSESNYMNARRLSWNVEDLNDSSKANRLKELVAQAASEDRKVIVFSFFLDTIRKIKDFLGDCCSEPINGSVPPIKRQEIIDKFDKADSGAVLLAQIQSGGTGLNIQSASVVIICEPQLKPSIENQAISRAYRMGQARNVLVYRLVGEDTIDEQLIEVLGEKQGVFDAFADESIVATKTQEIEIDEKKLKELMEKEREKIEK